MVPTGPFATGKRVKQANLLLHQIVDSPNTRYVLIPNQHIGVYKVGFAAEWISREYLARHGGAKIRREHLEPARCPLLGYAMKDRPSTARRSALSSCALIRRTALAPTATMQVQRS